MKKTKVNDFAIGEGKYGVMLVVPQDSMKLEDLKDSVYVLDFVIAVEPSLRIYTKKTELIFEGLTRESVKRLSVGDLYVSMVTEKGFEGEMITKKIK